VLEVGLKVRVVGSPEVWGKAFNFPRTCTISWAMLMNP